MYTSVEGRRISVTAQHVLASIHKLLLQIKSCMYVRIRILSVKDVAGCMGLECGCFASKSVERWQFGERVTSDRAQLLSAAFHFSNASFNVG